MSKVGKTKTAAPFTDEELRSFLVSRRIVIADAARFSGRSLRKFLMQFGAKSDDVVVCETKTEAERAIAEKPTHFLFVDVLFGLELVALQEKAFPSRSEVATVVLTTDPSAMDLGRISEQNVDAVLIKPFHFQSFQDAVHQALSEKIKPSAYTELLEKGKGLFHSECYEEAIAVFESSKALDPLPLLSFYYLGLIAEKRGDLDGAIRIFEGGLQLDPKDYRCLTGSFDVYLAAARWSEAYEIAKRIHQDYPVSPGRILDLVKLSVQTRRFVDILDYCNIFQSLEQKDEGLSRTVIAGMLVCSKYLALKGDKAKGRETLNNAAQISLTSGMLESDVLRYFVETENFPEGLEYHGKLSESVREKPEVQVLYLELLHAAGDAAAVFEIGTRISSTALVTPRIYRLVIENARLVGKSAKTVEHLLSEARAKFPNDAKLFSQ
jgi:tetratricopeptide (TPR) repeat protein